MAADLSPHDSAPQADTASPLPFAFARRFGVVVTNGGLLGEAVTVTCLSQPTLTVLAEIKRVTKRPMNIEIVARDEFEQRLTAAYVRDASEAKQMVADLGEHPDLASLAKSVPEGEGEDLLDQRNDAPIVQLITAVLAEAIREGASDVHIETFEKSLQVRFRIDGVMREMVQPKRALAPLLVSRVKVMAKLDIAEKRVPQDGRITLKIGGREVDVRVSTLPTANGERVVLRLLDKQTAALALPHLGMDAETLSRVRDVVAKPHGIFLVTGPTGHGKTTTLYAAMSELNRESINILTIENPIEYSIAGIGQTQVNEKADMTFARGLRAILRQDPDVVMVGEIRDLETAQTAVHASLTGHLVMSTVHTNTAVGAVTRLVDIGVEPFLIASSVVGILAQRLVRVLCNECKSASEPNSRGADVSRRRRRGRHRVPADGVRRMQRVGFPGAHGNLRVGQRGRPLPNPDPRPSVRADHHRPCPARVPEHLGRWPTQGAGRVDLGKRGDAGGRPYRLSPAEVPRTHE